VIITIDGPAGSGKSTISKMLAQKLGISFLDTGAMYRAVTLQILNSKTPIAESAQMENLLDSIELKLDGGRIYLNGRDVSGEIRAAEIDRNVSKVSELRSVRVKMTALQQKTACRRDYVCEGRDMGSAVFPDADFKFYLDASPGERARRRAEQLKRNGMLASIDNAVLARLKDEMIERDRQDTARELSPLTVPVGAVVIDTTGLSLRDVLQKIVSSVDKK